MENDSRIHVTDAADATIVDEVPAQPQIDPPVPHENIALVILLVILSSAVFAMAYTGSAHASLHKATPLEQAKNALPAPVLVVLPPVEAIRIAPAQTQNGNMTSFNGALSKAKKMRLQAERLTDVGGHSPNIPPVGSRLTMESYNTMRTYLARKEGITNANDANDVLLKAGYALPRGVSSQEKTRRDHVSFAREVVNSLVKDEVESFLHKVGVVSKVGGYVVEQK